MKPLMMSVVMMLMLGLAGAGATGEDAGEEVTLKGTMTCAKCDLEQADACQNALIVTENDEETVYLLAQNDVSKDFHKNVCQGAKEDVTVTGKVSEEDGQKVITASKIEG